jgi:hypothetical protein
MVWGAHWCASLPDAFDAFDAFDALIKSHEEPSQTALHRYT